MRDVSCGASGCSGGGLTLREWPWVVVEGSYVGGWSIEEGLN